MAYTYFMPTINVMGAGCLNSIGEHVSSLGGKKSFIVAGCSKHGAALADQVATLLNTAGIKTEIFAKSEPNPTDNTVHAGAQRYAETGCDNIVAVGGGSPMDAAKGMGIIINNGGNIRDYAGLDQSSHPMPPFIAVNTTAGTASEMTRFTIITNTETHVKMAIVDWRVTPNISINDPELMTSMSPSLTAATGMDALTHAVEAYVSTAATPVTDSAAIKAIELVGKYLPAAVDKGEDMEAREQMVYAEFMAGMAFNNASLGYVHAMAHQLGGLYDLPHGVCNAILLPHVSAFNLKSCPDRFADIAGALGVDTTGMETGTAAMAAVEAIKKLAARVGIPAGLKALEVVKEKDFPTLADNAMKDACGLTNPIQPDKEQVIDIYRAAL